MRAPKKAILLVLLALVLGASVFYFVLGGEVSRRVPPRRVAVDTSTVRNPRKADESAGREQVGGLADPRASVEAAPSPEVRAAYEGTVIGDGEPLQGASVEISVRGEPLADAQTDERGRFRIAIPPPDDPALLCVRARGFVPLERTLTPRMRGGTELLGNLRVIRGVRLTGKVIDARGNGIADAEIAIEPGNTGTDVLRARGRSSADGTFEVADVPPGPVVVRARARGFGERTVEHSGKVDEPLEIQLQPGHEMRFRVITTRGEPVVNAEVTILPVQTPGTNQTPRANQRSARTDATGRAAFESLGTTQWNVRITHPDYKTTGRSNVEANGIEETFEFQPWPGIAGQVYVTGGGRPPEGTRVQAMPATAPGDRMVVEGGGQPVDEEGRFHIGGLRPGDWVIRVSAPGYAPTQSAPVRLGLEGEAWAGSIELESAAKLQLRITREDRAVAGALVELVSVAPTPAQLWAFQDSRELSGPDGESDVEGRVLLSDLPTGSVWALVFADGSPPFVAGPLEVIAGQTRGEKVELPKGARVAGLVKTDEGRPCTNAQLRLTERDGKLGYPMTLSTDGSGRYTSPWLPAGHYTVEAFTSTEPTRRSGPQEFALAPGEQNEMDISL